MAMWIGERITENGIGNGISLLIFAGIIANIATSISSNTVYLVQGVTSVLPTMIASILVFVVLIIGIVFVDLGERRIPIQYSKRMVGRRMYGGQSSHIPLKLNASGVLPLIFASSIMQFPSTILAFFPNSAANRWWSANVQMMSWTYQIIFALMIFGFTFFYSSISFNPVEIAKNIQNNGGMIPGIRQGKPTSDFIKKISTRITAFGAIYLAILAVIPTVVYAIFGVSLSFAASSLMIAVSVAMESMRQLESEMMMRHYKGFL
jgi:preprotein translocase subunit SecY